LKIKRDYFFSCFDEFILKLLFSFFLLRFLLLGRDFKTSFFGKVGLRTWVNFWGNFQVFPGIKGVWKVPPRLTFSLGVPFGFWRLGLLNSWKPWEGGYCGYTKRSFFRPWHRTRT